MSMNPELKNVLSHSFRMVCKENDGRGLMVVPMKKIAERICEETDGDLRTAIAWSLDYKELPEMERVGWTVKPKDKFV